MAVVGSGDQDTARRIRVVEQSHDVGAAADHAQRVSVRHGFAEDGQTRGHAGNGSLAAQGRTEARLHLVEHEQGTISVADLLQRREIAGTWWDHADVLQNRLSDDARYRIAAHDILHRVDVVIIHHVDTTRDLVWNSR